jgi:hypothetical protein
MATIILKSFKACVGFAIMAATLLLPSELSGRILQANPSTYRNLIGALVAGDTLQLAAGNYVRITLQNLQGTQNNWISISGPMQGAPAIITGESCCNTVQIYECGYVAIRNLTIDIGGLAVDGINAKDYPSHHILIENCTIKNFPTANQQIVGISTKSPAWNWIIRNNSIIEPGTGLYLGNSDGKQPFVGGTIEGNRIVRPIGYCMEIKYQVNYQLPAGMPDGAHTTIIRNNVFLKDNRASPDGARPNLLVDGFPDSGTGSQDHYEIYGNFFYYNGSEKLFQASGRISLHDNLFVNPAGGALIMQAHDGKTVKVAHVYHNTIYATGTGIGGSTAVESQFISGNLVFAATPIGMTGAGVHDNRTDALANAAAYVKAPSFTLGNIDFYPIEGQCIGPALDMSLVNSNLDYNKDFNGTGKGAFTFRGCYAGYGSNPGWQPDSTLKSDAGSGAFYTVPRITSDRPVSMRVIARHAAHGVVVRISTTIASYSTLCIFDVSGRCVGSPVQYALDAGTTDIIIGPLKSTRVYLVKLTSGTVTVADKIYLIN